MLFTFILKCTAHIGFYIFILSKDVTIWEQNHVIIKQLNKISIFDNYFGKNLDFVRVVQHNSKLLAVV